MSESLMSPLLAYGWQGLVLAIWFALAVGSFLNVVIYRLPVMLNREWTAQAKSILEAPAADKAPAAAIEPASDEQQEPFNLMVPRSRCPSCGALITAWQNIPVLSWLMLRGRCANCKTHIPARYPLVELFTALATLLVLNIFGLTWLGLSAAMFTWILIALTFIDFDTQLLPDQLTLPLMWLGLLCNLSGSYTSLESAVIGAVAGYLFLWSTYWGFKLVTGKEGMGYGDFKLFAAIGAWFGWQVLPGTILIASGAGLLYALITLIGKQRESSQPIAFGPFLAVGGWVSLLARDNVIAFFTP
jgi:leader peptidase (prepilin peptidase)/N-methyltransferase